MKKKKLTTGGYVENVLSKFERITTMRIKKK